MGSNLTAAGGIGYTVVDSVDTMLLMGLTEEYERARDWVATNMTFDRDANFNTFEVRPILLGILRERLRIYEMCSTDRSAPDRLLSVSSAASSRHIISPTRNPSSSKKQKNLQTASFPSLTPSPGSHSPWSTSVNERAYQTGIIMDWLVRRRPRPCSWSLSI